MDRMRALPCLTSSHLTLPYPILACYLHHHRHNLQTLFSPQHSSLPSITQAHAQQSEQYHGFQWASSRPFPLGDGSFGSGMVCAALGGLAPRSLRVVDGARAARPVGRRPRLRTLRPRRTPSAASSARPTPSRCSAAASDRTGRRARPRGVDGGRPRGRPRGAIETVYSAVRTGVWKCAHVHHGVYARAHRTA